MRVGIVGFGVVGKKRFKSIRANTSFKIVAISDSNKVAKDSIPSSIGIFTDFKDLISKAAIDIIFISLPNQFASEAVILSLKKGFHVFYEKPPSRSLQELLEVKKCSEENPHLKLMYGFNHRFHLSVEEAKSIINNRSLGNIINMKGVYGKS